MWESWNLGAEPATGRIVDEPGWWDRYGLEFPVQSRPLKEVATLGDDGVWRMNTDHAITAEIMHEAVAAG